MVLATAALTLDTSGRSVFAGHTVTKPGAVLASMVTFTTVATMLPPAAAGGPSVIAPEAMTELPGGWRVSTRRSGAAPTNSPMVSDGAETPVKYPMTSTIRCSPPRLKRSKPSPLIGTIAAAARVCPAPSAFSTEVWGGVSPWANPPQWREAPSSQTQWLEPGVQHRFVADGAEVGTITVALVEGQEQLFGWATQRRVALPMFGHQVVSIVVEPGEPLAVDVGAVHVDAARWRRQSVPDDRARQSNVEVFVDSVARKGGIDRVGGANGVLRVPPVYGCFVCLAARPHPGDFRDGERVPGGRVRVGGTECCAQVTGTLSQPAREQCGVDAGFGLGDDTVGRPLCMLDAMLRPSMGVGHVAGELLEVPPRAPRHRRVERPGHHCVCKSIGVGEQTFHIVMRNVPGWCGAGWCVLGVHDTRR